MAVTLGPGLRVIPPSPVLGDRWVADDLAGKRRFIVNRRVAAALVAAIRPVDADVLAGRLAAISGSLASWQATIDDLVARRLLVDAEASAADPDDQWVRTMTAAWGAAGWREAAEYHVLSFDYPCIDYAEASAVGIDRTRMAKYEAEEPDRNRYKLDYVDRPGQLLPAPAAVGATASVHDLWTGKHDSELVTLDRLATVLALTFGVTDERMPVSVSTPLLRRTSPSGGGRNPSEGYVLVREISGLAPGWHHVTGKPFSIRFLGSAGADAVSRLFPDLPANAAGVVVFTSLFERNMYRYREPRTFRTIHMDAGHLIGTARIVAESVGLRAVAGDAADALAIETALGLDGLAEGFIGALALCDAKPQTADMSARPNAPVASPPPEPSPHPEQAGWPVGLRIRTAADGRAEVADTIGGATTYFEPLELAAELLASDRPPAAVQVDDCRATLTAGLRHWQHRHWHPSDQFYTASRRAPLVTRSTDVPPRPVPGRAVVLPAPAAPGTQPVSTVLLARRTGRAYARRTTPAETLSGLLRHGFADPLTPRAAAHWDRAVWTIGVCIFNVAGIASGAYRYSPHTHQLHEATPGDHRQTMIGILQGMRSPASAGWTLGLIADFTRAQQVMPHEAGLRSLYTQSGVLAQELIVLAGSYGLSTLVTPAQIDSSYLALHGLTRDEHGPIYTLTMGQSRGAAGVYPDAPTTL